MESQNIVVVLYFQKKIKPSPAQLLVYLVKENDSNARIKQYKKRMHDQAESTYLRIVRKQHRPQQERSGMKWERQSGCQENHGQEGKHLTKAYVDIK